MKESTSVKNTAEKKRASIVAPKREFRSKHLRWDLFVLNLGLMPWFSSMTLLASASHENHIKLSS